MSFVGACVLNSVTTVLVVDSCVVDTGVEVTTGICVVSFMTVLGFV